MGTKTLIVHGWSDCSESFVALKKFLVDSGISTEDTVFYADYQSREDNITFDDVVDGLNDRLRARQFIDDEGNALTELNVIVHSTGGLVIRHWIARYYLEPTPRIEKCPIKRIIMLAPANFGSPLAHRGKSFLGELFKGRWKLGDFLEVGRRLLDGLELGSPYQWQLAHRDLLGSTPPYTPERIQLTVLVGIEDYSGMRGWVNKPGTDGTVVIAGTSLDAIKVCLDCTKPTNHGEEYEPFTWSQIDNVQEFAFGVLPDLNHGTIVSNVGDPEGGMIGPWILKALCTAGPQEFRSLIAQLKATTGETYARILKPKYQQFAVHAVDDACNSIGDFTLEFFISRAARAPDRLLGCEGDLDHDERRFSDDANRVITSEFHPHSIDPSYRRFLVDVPKLKQVITTAKAELGSEVVLAMRVYVPRVDGSIKYAVDRLQNIVLSRTDDKISGPKFLFENTTTLLELKIDRMTDYVTVGPDPHKYH